MDHLVCFLIFFFSLIAIQQFVEAKINGFTIDLIHRDSPLSPFYNKTATPEDLARNDALRSIARSNYFSQSSKKFDSFDEKKFESTVTAIGPGYLMTISIGTPPVEITAIVDTGSDLVWTHCSNCPRCYNQKGSSTYKVLSCNSESCQTLRENQRRCGSTNNECEYKYAYGGGTFTLGVLSNDTFSFHSTDGQPASFPNSVFGCDNNLGVYYPNSGLGLVGLGGGPLSLVSQLGDQIEHKFSYCLQPVNANAPSKLRFGANAVISGQGVVSTPIMSSPSIPTFYYLNLESVSLGAKMIANSKISPPGEGNIIIDSGSTLTMVESSFYSAIEDAVKEAVGVEQVQDPNGNYKLCYNYESSLNKILEVTMVFHFTRADVTLKALNLFSAFNGIICFAIFPSNGISLFGNVAQKNFGVEYDLAKKEVSFVPADCTRF